MGGACNLNSGNLVRQNHPGFYLVPTSSRWRLACYLSPLTYRSATALPRYAFAIYKYHRAGNERLSSKHDALLLVQRVAHAAGFFRATRCCSVREQHLPASSLTAACAMNWRPAAGWKMGRRADALMTRMPH